MRQILNVDFNAIFILQPVRENFELQLAHDSDDIALIRRLWHLKDLNGALLSQLRDSLDEMLALQGRLRLHFGKALRRKDGEILERDVKSRFADRIADGKNSGIEQSNHIAWIGFLHYRPFLRHELLRLRQRHYFA